MMMPPYREASNFIADEDADFIDDADTACVMKAIHKIQAASASSHLSVVLICDNLLPIADEDADFIDDADTACVMKAIHKIQAASASSHLSVVLICDNLLPIADEDAD